MKKQRKHDAPDEKAAILRRHPFGELSGQPLKRGGPPPAFLAYWKRSPIRSFLTVSAHFDGKFIVPDEPLDLPPNQALIVQIERVGGEAAPAEESVLTWLAANALT